QLVVCRKGTSRTHDDRVRPLGDDFTERALIFGRRRLLEWHTYQGYFQSSARLTKLLPAGTFPLPAHRQEGDLGCRRHDLLEDLQALSPDLCPCVNSDAGDVAAGVCQARCEACADRIASYPNDWYCGIRRARRLCDRVGAGNDHIGVPVGDLAREVGIAL